MSDVEEWRDIPCLTGLYEASSLGRIRSRHRVIRLTVRGKPSSRTMNGTVLSPAYSGEYLCVSPCKHGRHNTMLVHRLVADAFLDKPASEEELYINHVNGVKEDNRPCNLEWVTRSQNMRHAVDVLGICRGVHIHSSKLNDHKVREIRRLRGSGVPIAHVARLYGVSVATVSEVAHRKMWRHVQ